MGMGMGGMSNKEQGTLHSLRGAAGETHTYTHTHTEREREGENKRGKDEILLHCMDCLLEQGGACRGRDTGDSYQCVCESRREKRKRV